MPLHPQTSTSPGRPSDISFEGVLGAITGRWLLGWARPTDEACERRAIAGRRGRRPDPGSHGRHSMSMYNRPAAYSARRRSLTRGVRCTPNVTCTGQSGCRTASMAPQTESESGGSLFELVWTRVAGRVQWLPSDCEQALDAVDPRRRNGTAPLLATARIRCRAGSHRF